MIRHTSHPRRRSYCYHADTLSLFLNNTATAACKPPGLHENNDEHDCTPLRADIDTRNHFLILLAIHDPGCLEASAKVYFWVDTCLHPGQTVQTTSMRQGYSSLHYWTMAADHPTRYECLALSTQAPVNLSPGATTSTAMDRGHDFLIVRSESKLGTPLQQAQPG